MPDLYISGSLGMQSHRQRVYEATPHRLLSLHASYLGVARTFIRDIVDARDTTKMSLMLDSGAFTSWNKGEPDINVKNLLTTYKRVHDFCKDKFRSVLFISLDKIPGSPGRTASYEEIKEAIAISDANHKILADVLGNAVLPVMHQSEPVERLHEVVSMNPEYICVSPRNDVVEKFRRAWAQRVHQLIPGVNTHGLAATGGETMLETPWKSVDSASWILVSSYGMVFLPVKGTIKTLAISEHSSAKREWGKHADNVASPQIQALLNEYCERLSLTREELRTKPGARELFNVAVMSEIAAMPHTPVPIQQTLIEL